MFKYLYRVITSIICLGWSSGMAVAEQQILTPKESWKLITEEQAVVLDVRSDKERAEGVLPNAIEITHTDVIDNLEMLNPYKDKTILIYCAVGGRAGFVKNELEKHGYEKVINVGGYKELVTYGQDNGLM